MSGAVKGWCPGAHRPMMSGDGLVVRVRPVMGRLSATQAMGLADLAITYGSGFLDLTNRANLQIRAVPELAYPSLVASLSMLGLVDDDPAIEARRNILVQPFWAEGDLTSRLNARLVAALVQMPDLPAKFGFAIDTGPRPLLRGASADIRIERTKTGLIVRADDAASGRAVTEEQAVDAVLDLARHFAEDRGESQRRMRAFVRDGALGKDWTGAAPLSDAQPPVPGPSDMGRFLGAAFGQIDAQALKRAFTETNATGLRVTPWRLFLIETTAAISAPGFVTTADDPRLTIDACPGAPLCLQASVETRALAATLAAGVNGRLHVSGCAKGCARSGAADVTLVGRDGLFDLVIAGRTTDSPLCAGISPAQVAQALRDHQ